MSITRFCLLGHCIDPYVLCKSTQIGNSAFCKKVSFLFFSFHGYLKHAIPASFSAIRKVYLRVPNAFGRFSDRNQC